MTVKELIELTGATDMTPDSPKDTEVTCGYTCDLLSWVMAHGKAGMAWITVQTHMNVIAVASLMEMAAVIIPEDIEMEEATLQKAKEEDITVLQSSKTGKKSLHWFAFCGGRAAGNAPGGLRHVR